MNVKLEDLEINNYMIYQDKDSFNFGIDAVLLANFAIRNMKSDEKNICDFCTGTLPIPLIMFAKRKGYFKTDISITAFEIEKDSVDLCNKSIDYNNEHDNEVKKSISVINDDIKNIYLDREKYKSIYESFDAITCNPPYIKKGSGIVNDNDKKIIARHEVSITFEEICKAASLILKSNKRFYIIHHSERFTEIVSTLKNNFFEIKKVQFIYPYIDKPSNLVLIEAVKNANVGITVLEPIIVYDKDNNYTEKVLKIYGK